MPGFSQSNTPISKIIHQYIWAASEFYFSSECNNESLKPIPTHWSPPPPNFLKINCDASFLNSTKESGCAVVCRDSLGAWVVGLVWRGYHASSHHAELKAIELALKLIKTRNWQNINVYSDAKRVVDEIIAPGCESNVPSTLSKCRDHLLITE
ncbi:uncharacterized protein LOC110689488 [Chenopodium quinoa]|uniref:uncharacterized protein LOC110689488 n=1 Tax=Chenopodium quinoa TaxID=63459 RepID=UPI000B77502F|nr:uncharacterized protein LOC110689488 [Chenopodium quinoa]